MSEPVVPCPTCPEGWRPLDKEHCADCYEGKIERLNTRIEALEAALEAVRSEVLLTGHLAELVDAALAPEQDK